MKKGSWFVKCRAMLCIILCFAMVLPFAGCKKNDVAENESISTDGSKYDINEADYDTYIEYEDMLLSAEAAYLNSDGYVENSDIPSMFDEVEELIQQGILDDAIESYNRDEYSIFIKFTSGIPYLFVPYQEGMLSSGGGGKILTLEPNENDYSVNQSRILAMLDAWGNDIQYGDSLRPISNAKSIVETLPDLYSYDEVPVDLFKPVVGVAGSLRNENVTVERMKALADYKILIWEGHGAYNEEIHSALVTGEPFVGWEEFSKYKDDLEENILVLTSFPTIGDTDIAFSPVRYYCITSKFIEKYLGEMDESLVFLGACESLKDDVLANAFLEKGASIVLGYTEVTSMPYEMLSRSLFFYNLVQTDGLSFPSVADAYQKTISTVGDDYYSTNGSILSCISHDGIDNRYTLNGIFEEPLIVEIPNGTEPEPEKLLTQINQYDDAGNLTSEYIVSYNEKGLVSSTTQKYYYDYEGNYDISETVQTYFYDSHDNLIRVEKPDSELDYVFVDEYIYNEYGQLISSSYQTGEGWSEHTYEYDSEGRQVKVVSEYDPYIETTKYSYNPDGLLIEAQITEDYYGTDYEEYTRTYEYDSDQRLIRTETKGSDYIKYETYEYDSQGRIAQYNTKDNWDTTQETYIYDYKPFVVEEEINKSQYGDNNSARAFLYDDAGNWLHTLYLEAPQLFVDVEGYLAKVVDESGIYEFYYSGEPAIAIEGDTEDTSVSSEHVSEVSGPLTYPISEEACYIIYKNWNGSELDESEYAAVTKRYSPDSEYAHFMLEFYWSDFTASGVPEWYFEIDLNTGECMAGPTGSPPRTFNAEDYYY